MPLRISRVLGMNPSWKDLRTLVSSRTGVMIDSARIILR